MTTRVERVKVYKDKVIREWSKKWWSFMMKHESKLDWYYISENPNLTIDMINANLDKTLKWDWISGNPNLTMDFINANPDKPWKWKNISNNNFTKSKVEFINKKYREYLAAYQIQQWWHRIRMDPHHPVGIRRLEREYDELYEADTTSYTSR